MKLCLQIYGENKTRKQIAMFFCNTNLNGRYRHHDSVYNGLITFANTDVMSSSMLMTSIYYAETWKLC
jgi:hypothetical protein